MRFSSTSIPTNTIHVFAQGLVAAKSIQRNKKRNKKASTHPGGGQSPKIVISSLCTLFSLANFEISKVCLSHFS